MSQQSPEEPMSVTQEEVSSAEAAEQALLKDAQVQHLMRRVVVLRVRNTRLEEEIRELRDRVAMLEVPDAPPEGDDTNAETALNKAAED